jgi:hypothetical protein
MLSHIIPHIYMSIVAEASVAPPLGSISDEAWCELMMSSFLTTVEQGVIQQGEEDGARGEVHAVCH